MTNVSKAQLQKAIAAIQRVQRERSKHPAALRPDHRQLAKLKKSRAASEKMLAAFFQEAGLNIQEFEALQQRRGSDLAGMVEQQKADALQRAAGAKDTFYSSVRAQTQAWQDLSPNDDFFPYPTFTLENPWVIEAMPPLAVNFKLVEFGTWAKFQFVSTEPQGTERVSFYFFWQSPFSEYAVINAVTCMSATGHLQAEADWSWEPNVSFISASADFGVWLGFPNNPTSSDYSQYLFNSTGALSNLFLGGDTEGTSVSDGCQLFKTMFAVPPGALVVFEVALEIDYSIQDSGSVKADFESGDFKIECPLVVYELLYPPPTSS